MTVACGSGCAASIGLMVTTGKREQKRTSNRKCSQWMGIQGNYKGDAEGGAELIINSAPLHLVYNALWCKQLITNAMGQMAAHVLPIVHACCKYTRLVCN